LAEFRATSFDNPPFFYKTEDGGYGGWEFNIIDSIATSLNFQLDIQPPPNGELWGENIDGEYTGLVGQLQRAHSDLAWADLFIVEDRKKYIDYTTQYMSEYACFMLQKPPPLPGWLSVVLPFGPFTWLAVLITIVVVDLFYPALTKFSFLEGGFLDDPKFDVLDSELVWGLN
jgi:hypothetical protein